MDQLQAMRVFVRVVEAGNFSRAAESLGLPRASVTKQIQALESLLHTRLLNRTTRRVTVTPDGAAYYERSAGLLADFDDLQASMVNAQARPGGRICIDVSSTIARTVIVPALGDFLARYPDIDVDIGVSDKPVDLLAENIDIGLRAGPVIDESLVARRIGQLRIVTVAAPAYLARCGMPTHPRELENGRHALVGFFQHGGGRRRYPHVFQSGDEHVEIGKATRLSANEIYTHLSIVLAGQGVGQTLDFVAEPWLRRGELVSVLSDWTRPALPVYVVYPPNRHLSARVRVFVDWLVELFSLDPRLQLSEPAVGAARSATRQAPSRSTPPLASGYPGSD